MQLIRFQQIRILICSPRFAAVRSLFVQAEHKLPTTNNAYPKPSSTPHLISSSRIPILPPARTTAPPLSMFGKLKKYLSDSGPFRWLAGRRSINASRLQELKRKDNVSPMSAMVYAYGMESSLRGVSFLINCFAGILALGGIKWYWDSGFRIRTLKEVDRSFAGNPLKFDTLWQYGVVFLFALFLCLTVNFIRRKAVLRGYYDSKTNLFTFVKISGLGWTKSITVKPGHVKHVERRGLGQFLGNVTLLDANRKPEHTLILPQGDFSWNKLKASSSHPTQQHEFQFYAHLFLERRDVNARRDD